MKRNAVALSILALSVSLIISSWLVADGIHSLPNGWQIPEVPDSPAPSELKPLLNQTELAEYLGLNANQIQELIPFTTEEGDIISRLPYIQIENVYYFPREAIEQWLRTPQFYENDGVN